jgi:hypothetical protein
MFEKEIFEISTRKQVSTVNDVTKNTVHWELTQQLLVQGR